MRKIGSPFVDKNKLRAFLKDPLLKIAVELLNLSRNKLRTRMGLLTGHCHLKGHDTNWTLVHSPECDRCKQASEMVSLVVCDCVALASVKFTHLDQQFMNQVTRRKSVVAGYCILFNPLNPELNPICYLLALLAHHFLHVSRIRVKLLTIRLLMSYIYGAPILDVSRSHTTTQHSR